MNRVSGLRQLPFGDEFDVGAADFERQRAAGVVVVGALLEIALVEVARDDDVLRRRGIAGDGRVDDFKLAGKRLGLDAGPNRDGLAAGEPADQLPAHARRHGPTEARRSGGDVR